MDTYWQKLRFLRKKELKSGLGKAARVAASLGLVFSVLGPNPYSPLGQAPLVAQAKALEWSDVRPPLTDEADTNEAGGFDRLPRFGNVYHAIAVAPNGDIFVGGNREADVDGNTDGDCADTADRDNDGDGVCDATYPPVMYKSTDGGKKWRAAALPATTDGSLIRDIAVSPDYPSDAVILVAFSDADGADDEAADGIAISTNGGNTFTVAFSGATAPAGAAATIANIEVRTVALSPDFNYGSSSGVIAIGGLRADAAGGTVARVNTDSFKANDNDANGDGDCGDAGDTDRNGDTVCQNGAPGAVWNSMGNGAEEAGDLVLDLEYAKNENTRNLGRLIVLTDDDEGTTSLTHAQVTGGAAFAVFSNSSRVIGEDGAITANAGQVAFNDDTNYREGDRFFVATGATGANTGGIFAYGGTWDELTDDEDACDDFAYTGLSVTGSGSSTTIIGTTSGNTICSSTNNGSSFNDAQVDGDPDLGILRMGGGITTVAARSQEQDVVYIASAGNLGGVARSTDTGGSFRDTGLTNQAYVVTSMTEVDAQKSFASATEAGSGLDAIFWTENYGTGAAWVRSVRYTGTDLSLVDPASDFTTTGVAYIRRTEATSDNVLKTTDGGRNWDDTGSDPFKKATETDELAVASSQRSATTLYIGGSKGSVAVTTDGGASWTILAKDFGNKIDEFDFKSATTFFVTALDTDTVMKVWLTKDSGGTFAEVGDASRAWGTGDAAITTNVTAYDAAAGGIILVTTDGASTNDLWYYNTNDSSPAWKDTDTNQSWDSMLVTKAEGIGDGWLISLWDNDGDFDADGDGAIDAGIDIDANSDGDVTDAGGGLVRIYEIVQLATDAKDYNDVALFTQPAPVYTTGTTLGTSDTEGGYTIQMTANGRVQDNTLTTAYQAGIKLLAPADNTSVPTNTGDNGVATVFRWDSVTKAACYEIQISLEESFDAPALDSTAVAGACPAAGAPGVTTGSVLQVGTGVFSLIQGTTYYWRARVRATDASRTAGVTNPGPWSAAAKFSVSTTSPTVIAPEPQLPLENSTAPNVGPIEFSFNTPAGTVQYHIQVVPLNNDGPAIDLIIGDPALVSQGKFTAQPPVLGQGNYVLLPGSTYTWRVRVTNKSGEVAATDPVWGPWSVIRTFKTPKPSPFSLSLQAVGTGNVTTDTTPTLAWKDSNVNNFYYEVQLSGDPNFNLDPATATSFVYWNLIHGGEANPVNSWTVPDDAALAKGKYYWRARQRVQATPLGPDEPGVGWSMTGSFTVQ